MKRGRLVMVEWEDSTAAAEWHERGDTLTTARCASVGWLTGKDRKRIVLSANHCDSGTPWGSRTAIPLSAVRKVKKL